MKKNIEEIKIKLEGILKNMPNDFVLEEVKSYIRLAISKIEKIKQKREKREEKKITRKEKQKYKKESLSIIESLIEEEKEKIKKLEES